MANKRDYYEILGVSKNATEQEIKRAYRKIAKQYHPDTPNGDEEKFKEATEAYEVLTDPQKRAQYDRFGHGFQGGQAGAGGFSDMFSGGFSDMFSGSSMDDIFSNISDLFGGGRSRQANVHRPIKGENIVLNATLTLKEYIFGKNIAQTVKMLRRCDDCLGTGAVDPKNDVIKCDNCKGKGSTNTVQRTPFGIIQSEQICRKCNGVGKRIINKCKKCHGNCYRTKNVDLSFSIPASLDINQHLLIRGKGNCGLNGGENGDIYIKVFIKKDDEFKIINKYDLEVKLPVSYLDLILGATIQVPTFDGIKAVKIPPNTANNESFTLSNMGLYINNKRRGDLHVIVIATFPKKIHSTDKKILNNIRNSSNFKVNISKFER